MKIGILGLGTVGGGVVNVLARNKGEIFNRTGINIEVIIGAVKDKNTPRVCSDDDFGTLTDNVNDVINSDADIILELIGGTTLAKELVIQALNSGKHVITANKALIATHGNELLDLARKNGVKLLFEAAVAGGIPVLKALEQGLSANQITSIAGIINGTGNFILTEMRDKGRDFAGVLKEAHYFIKNKHNTIFITLITQGL
jgi:homoserine dehydrogenase